MPKIGVVGHVEWVRFAVVEELPQAGEIIQASATFVEPAGGGAVAAVQVRKLAGSATFFTALGDDAAAMQVASRLRGDFGLELYAGLRAGPQRRAFAFLDQAGERTITVLGERIVPCRSDPLPWGALTNFDAVYLVGGDTAAVKAARSARLLVASPRAMEALVRSGVEIDVLVYSATDKDELYVPGMLKRAPRFVVSTRGAFGGFWTGETSGSWRATRLNGAPVDTYGCGDSFAAALTFGLASGLSMRRAINLAARCGEACLCGRGPYAGQLERQNVMDELQRRG